MTVPSWLQQLVDELPRVQGSHFTRFLPPEEGGRVSAVLVLFGEGERGPDLLLIERAHTMRSHAGQPAFPGGAEDPDDESPVAVALREAQEEVGLDPSTVEVLGTLPALFLPPSGFVVHPIVAWWRDPHPVRVVDEAEVAAVVRVPLADLTDPAHRYCLTHPNGYVSPAFDVAGLTVWGFTAGLIAGILTLAGWERPWDTDDLRPLDLELLHPTLRAAQDRSTP